jgi:hypothetical protein
MGQIKWAGRHKAGFLSFPVDSDGDIHCGDPFCRGSARSEDGSAFMMCLVCLRVDVAFLQTNPGAHTVES